MVRMVVGAGCQSLPASMPANDDDGVGGGCVCVRVERTEHRLIPIFHSSSRQDTERFKKRCVSQ